MNYHFSYKWWSGLGGQGGLDWTLSQGHRSGKCMTSAGGAVNLRGEWMGCERSGRREGSRRPQKFFIRSAQPCIAQLQGQ